MMKQQFICDRKPKARPENVITGAGYRITFLTDRLVRFEYDRSGEFVDDASQVIWYRDLEDVPFEIRHKKEYMEIQTKSLRIRYDGKPFEESILSVRLRKPDNGCDLEWYYGKNEDRNLFGTARTLDEANGSIPLEKGILSRDGFAVLDDSKTILLTEDGWVKERKQTGEDFYLFAYGHDYRGAVRDFLRAAGRVPMLPKYALGNWWSRYYEYSQEEYKKLMDRFLNEEIPFSVAVIDMDWHITDIDPKYGSGWTGYTWNRKLFPDPKAFADDLHDRGMKVTLNVHPALGIRGSESMYEEMAEAMGVDPATDEPVEFDITNPKFLENYFEIVHHPLEEDGVDFWWLDWQQGGHTAVKGLDPLWMLNHYHYLDSGRDGKRRMTFSRYAGPGSHRYPIGFSGDTVVTWESLDFQPYFTATASNIGYGWWSHDIGGHMLGNRSDVMEARWYELGTFSPVNRLHSTKMSFSGKEPWNFRSEVEQAMGEALRLRHQLLPYIYTMNYLAYKEYRPLIAPMYYDYPEDERAYTYSRQYMFGDNILVAPIGAPMENGVSDVKVWLPAGNDWYEWHTGTLLKGGQELIRQFSIEEYPIYVKAGAVIPMYGKEVNSLDDNPKKQIIGIFPGVAGEFSIYEDEGNDQRYATEYATTRVTSQLENRIQRIKIAPREGHYRGMSHSKDYIVRLYGAEMPRSVSLNGMKVNYTVLPNSSEWSYCGKEFMVSIPISNADCNKSYEIVVEFDKANVVDVNDGMIKQLKTLHRAIANRKFKYAGNYVVPEVTGFCSETNLKVSYDPDNFCHYINYFKTHFQEAMEITLKDDLVSPFAK